MNPIKYLRSRGIRGAFQVIWQFKLPKLQIAICALLTRKRALENKIVIESHNDFDCNGGAFYDWLISKGYNDKIKIVWRLYHDKPGKLPKNVQCVPVYGPNWRKAWNVCTARWLTADCTVVDKVRDDQISIYMTHGGFGLKNCCGLIDVPSSVDYVLSPSGQFDNWTRRIYGIETSGPRLVHVGYPSLDRLYSRRHSSGYKGKCDRGYRTILWMPTFRQSEGCVRADSEGSYPYGVPLIVDEDSLNRLAAVLRRARVHLVIKLHPKQDLSLISGKIPSGIDFITGRSIKNNVFDNYDLMLDADAMIGDYSGAIFEYLILNRPIAFVLSDLAEYKIGLIDNAETYMVGTKIYDFAGLERFILDVSEGIDSTRTEREILLSSLYQAGNEQSCEKVANLIGIDCHV